MAKKRIVVVGGGAGGLGLVTRLGRTLGRRGKADVVLVDRSRTHLWKPLLHEVAAGSLDPGVDAVAYRAHARDNGYRFQLGAMCGLDRAKQQLRIAPLHDEDGNQILPARTLDYDILVLAIGSDSNDFGTQGVRDNCIFLDQPSQAERFHTRLLNLALRTSVSNDANARMNIAIVGGGATGVELSAELYNAVQQMKAYGVENIDQSHLNITLLEAGERILPVLPERISAAAHNELVELGVNVKTDTMVTEATADGLKTASGEFIPADMMVWAAGIKAPEFLKQLDGLETNRINQLVVEQTLQTKNDSNIFVIGDCASCAQADGRFVPPRAQSAHQMASTAYGNIKALLEAKPLKPFVYKDNGSLVSLSSYSTVGSLMGNLTRGSMMIEGRIARLVYVSLYRLHQVAIHGYLRTGMIALSGSLNRLIRPRLKLH